MRNISPVKQQRGRRSRQRGYYAEIIALVWLVLKGYSILAWRFRSKAGEIDIIARKRDVIAMIEVKLRADHASGAETMNPYDWQRRVNTADYFLARRTHLQHLGVRFDLMAVAPRLSLRHIKGAWDAAA